jgi:signal transduction histidine kinase
MDVTSVTGPDEGGEPARVAAAAAAWWIRLWDRIVEFVRDPVGTFRRTAELRGFDYSPATIFVADAAVVIAGVAAAILRRDYFPTVLPVLAVVILVVVYPLIFLVDLRPRPVVLGTSALLATALFTLQPVYPDCSALVLTLMAGEIAAIAPKRVSILYTGAGIAEILVFDAIGEHRDPGLPIYVTAVLLGWMVGLMLQFQRRSLYQEHENQQIRAAQAAGDERRRIAREVHDVIAHSLSITLLHLTAARHALETDRDVDEAIDALTDAERLGRQAMADIRHTVGLLDRRPSSTKPEPGLDDIADLVDDFVRAGLAVEYTLAGDPGSVSATAGLALYRISQESLSNIAKHAPGATVTVRIAITPAEVTVAVANTLPGGPPARRGRGMGIAGMRQRATLLGGTLTAGPDGGGWHVRARIPIDDPESGPSCPAGSAEEPLRTVRDAFTAMTRKLQESM